MGAKGRSAAVVWSPIRPGPLLFLHNETKHKTRTKGVREAKHDAVGRQRVPSRRAGLPRSVITFQSPGAGSWTFCSPTRLDAFQRLQPPLPDTPRPLADQKLFSFKNMFSLNLRLFVCESRPSSSKCKSSRHSQCLCWKLFVGFV